MKYRSDRFKTAGDGVDQWRPRRIGGVLGEEQACAGGEIVLLHMLELSQITLISSGYEMRG